MTKILLTVEDGKIRACANGEVAIYFEHMDNLNGLEKVEASEITNEEMDSLLKGKEPDVIL
jgi:hypothetical protein